MIAQNKTKGKRTFTPEQKEKYRTQKETQELEDLYKQFMEKKIIKDFIGIVATYQQKHKYSLRNLCYVLAQSEKGNDTKFVGIINSFMNWKKQEIQILKGSKGYKVIVPIFRKKDEQDKQEEKKEVLSYFKIGNVFDISQTTEYGNYLTEKEEIDEKIMKYSEMIIIQQ